MRELCMQVCVRKKKLEKEVYIGCEGVKWHEIN